MRGRIRPGLVDAAMPPCRSAPVWPSGWSLYNKRRPIKYASLEAGRVSEIHKSHACDSAPDYDDYGRTRPRSRMKRDSECLPFLGEGRALAASPACTRVQRSRGDRSRDFKSGTVAG